MTETRLYAFLALSKFPTAAQEDIVNNSCIKFPERENIWSKDVLKIGKVQRRACKGKCNMVANLTLIVCLYLTCGFAGALSANSESKYMTGHGNVLSSVPDQKFTPILSF